MFFLNIYISFVPWRLILFFVIIFFLIFIILGVEILFDLMTTPFHSFIICVFLLTPAPFSLATLESQSQHIHKLEYIVIFSPNPLAVVLVLFLPALVTRLNHSTITVFLTLHRLPQQAADAAHHGVLAGGGSVRGEERAVAGPRLSSNTDLRFLPPDAALHVLLAQTQGENGWREEGGEGCGTVMVVEEVGVELKDGEGWGRMKAKEGLRMSGITRKRHRIKEWGCED